MTKMTVTGVNLDHDFGNCWLTIRTEGDGASEPWLSAVRLTPEQLRDVLNDGLGTIRRVVDAESVVAPTDVKTLVHGALDRAKDNGYDFHGWSVEAIAVDLVDGDGDCQDLPLDEVEAAVREWRGA